MADLREEYGTGRSRKTDEYGNPVHTGTGVDEVGNPIYPSGTTGGHGGMTGATGGHGGGTGLTGTHGKVTDVGVGTGGQGQLRRSGSSSSSSSEEDEHGVRRKKGLKEKIKEKLPGGGHKETGDQMGTHGTGTTEYGTGQEHEKKGMMEKIKEKLPGGHKDEHQQTGHTTAGYGGTAGAPGTGYGTGTHGTEYGATTGHDQHEKKGMMEKIKEKMPGAGHKEY